MGFLVHFGVEHRRVAHADELLREDRKCDCAEVSEETTRQGNNCINKQLIGLKTSITSSKVWLYLLSLSYD